MSQSREGTSKNEAFNEFYTEVNLFDLIKQASSRLHISGKRN